MNPNLSALFLHRVDLFPYDRLPGFQAGRHFAPTALTTSADLWAKSLLETRIREELQVVYTAAKQELKLRHGQIKKHFDGGSGAVEAAAFLYSVEAGQNPIDPGEARLRRQLWIRDPELGNRLDQIFPLAFEEVVVPIGQAHSFTDLVNGFEDLRDKRGGTLHEDEERGLIEYLTADGKISLSLALSLGELTVRSRALTECWRLLRDGEWLSFLP